MDQFVPRQLCQFKRSQAKVSFISADSHAPATPGKLATLLDKTDLDLLFIDGDHSYNGVKQDFLTFKASSKTAV